MSKSYYWSRYKRNHRRRRARGWIDLPLFELSIDSIRSGPLSGLGAEHVIVNSPRFMETSGAPHRPPDGMSDELKPLAFFHTNTSARS